MLDYANSIVSNHPRSFEFWWCKTRNMFDFVICDERESIEAYMHQTLARYPSIQVYQLPRFPEWLGEVERSTGNAIVVEAYFCNGLIFTPLSEQPSDWDRLVHLCQAIEESDYCWAQALFCEGSWRKYVQQLTWNLREEAKQAIEDDRKESLIATIGPELSSVMIDKSLNRNILAVLRFLLKGPQGIEDRISAALSAFKGEYDHLEGHARPADENAVLLFLQRRMSHFPLDKMLSEYVRKFLLNRISPPILTLTPSELAGLFRLPEGRSVLRGVRWVRGEALPRIEPPLRRGVLIGHARGSNVPLTIPYEDLFQHIYIVGATGTGKSTLILNLIKQLTWANEKGVWNGAIHFIDPKGAASLDCVRILDNLQDAILLDPLETGFGLNVFELPSGLSHDEKVIATEATLDAFLRMMQEFFGVSLERMPRVIYIMTNCLRYLWRLSDSPTFADMYEMLLAMRSVDEWRKLLATIGLDEREIIESLEYVRELPSDARVAVMNKIEPFVKNQILRRLFCIRRSTLDMDGLLKPGKLVIWRVSVRGLEFIRSMIVSAIVLRIWFSILRRAHTGLGGKLPAVALIIDEFQHTQHLGVLKTMLSESRGYNVCLALAHQETHQIDESLLGSIFANSATQIVLRVSGEDAKRLAPNLDAAKAREIISIVTTQPDFNALVRLRAKGAEEQLTPFPIYTLPMPAIRSIEDVDRFIQAMKMRYAPRTVEEEPLLGRVLEKPWIKLLSEPLPDPLIIRCLDVIDRLKGDAYASRIAETLSIDRGLLSSKLDGLCKAGLLKREVATGRTTPGRPPTIFSLTENAERMLLKRDVAAKLSEARIGGEEASTIGREAVKHYGDDGCYVIVLSQGGTQKKPDLIAIPFKNDGSWDIENATAVEIETASELTTHAEQVKLNMLKNLDLGFGLVEVWHPKEFSTRLEMLRSELTTEKQKKVTICPV